MLQPSTGSMNNQSANLLGSRVERATKNLSLNNQWRLLIIVLVVQDTVTVGLALLLAYLIRFNTEISIFQEGVFSDYAYYQSVSLLLVPIWILIFAFTGLYNRSNLLGGTTEYSLIFRSTAVGIFTLVVISFFIQGFVLARGWLMLAWVSVFLIVALGRFFNRRVAYAFRRHGFLLTPAIIVGANQEGLALAEQLAAWQTSGLHVVGFVDDIFRPGSSVFEHLRCLGTIGQLDSLIQKHAIGEMILSSSSLSQDSILKLFKKFGMRRGLNLRLSSGLFEIVTTGMDVKEFAYVPLLRVRKVRLTGMDKALKLLLDYAIAIPALIGLSVIMLVISILIKLDSRGPIIYRRRVMGINGRQFDAYKFRTMYIDGDEILAHYPDLQSKLSEDYKLKDDPRITPMGHWLRRTSLDELPQLFNVLKREMSLVGPRIIAPREIKEYGDWDLNLLTVPPGITGLWQVSGRSDLTYAERVRLDMHYIRNWTIWLDVQLLWQTIPAVLRRRGAY